MAIDSLLTRQKVPGIQKLVAKSICRHDRLRDLVPVFFFSFNTDISGKSKLTGLSSSYRLAKEIALFSLCVLEKGEICQH